jgi:hypothetical protein
VRADHRAKAIKKAHSGGREPSIAMWERIERNLQLVRRFVPELAANDNGASPAARERTT